MIKSLVLLSVFTLAACGGTSSKKNNDTPAETPVLSFATDIAPILTAKCSPCHNEGKQAPAIVGNEANLKAAADSVAFTITTDDVTKMMPMRVKPRIITDDEKATLISFAKNPETLSFAQNVDPILKARCAPCHAAGGAKPTLIGDEASTRAEADDIIEALTTTDPAKAMPKQSKQKELTPEEKEKLLTFLGKN